MRRIFLILIVSAVIVALAWWLSSLRGHVALQIAGLTIEMTTPVFVLGLISLVLVSWAVFSLIRFLLTMPRRMRRWRAERMRRLGDAAVSRALVALAAGDAAGARRESAQARRNLGDTPHTLLLAAQAERLAGQESAAESLFRALAAREDAPLLGYRGLLQQAVAREDWERAAELARRAEDAYPGAAWLREERARMAIRTGAWKEALVLADAGGPRAAYATAAAQAETDPDESLRLARQAWKEDPALTPAALVYADRLRATGREGRAQAVLRDAWEAAPHPDVAAFALAGTADPMQRLKAAEKLVARNPEHPETNLLLARCALAAGLTGEARRHLETVRERLNERRVWMLMADLEEQEHGQTEAVRDALRHAAMADPDPSWRCAGCGTHLAQWHPVCPNCGTPGCITWEGAAKLAAPENNVHAEA